MSYDVDKKSGFISCSEIKVMHNTDVYYYANVLEPCGAGVGDTVCFVLHMSPSGRPQASLPVLRLSTPGDFARVGDFFASTVGGYLEGDEINIVFGRKVFVPPELSTHFKSGQRVAFNFVIATDGTPVMKEGRVVDLSWAPRRAALTSSVVVPGYAPSRLLGSSDLDGALPGEIPRGSRVEEDTPQVPRGRDVTEYTGRIKAVAGNGEFGFITCAESHSRYGKDVFVHSKQMGGSGLLKGSCVKFRVTLNWEDKPQAESCELINEPSPEDLQATALINPPPPPPRVRAPVVQGTTLCSACPAEKRRRCDDVS